ncbi:HD-GYP domain-containing protein [Pseudomonas sp. C27(2019)]|uniref:HD-GYP domain-containing protein n=1 Tax=Pseudomonas sp. C27(2019) TaxID=2604941 RepID=UPI0012482201|nr:HD-GYP domain-containing protein [Pseudomonas sp. C27(2019)]QEY57844.1 HD-GYP domain-containing protein [Pseudomonas sp. C27(2019)]
MLKKIAVADIKQGMYLHELCGSWMDHPFWKAGFVLNDPADLQSLKNSAVTEVWIDTSKGLDLPVSVVSEDPEQVQIRAEAVLQAAAAPPPKPVTMSGEIKRALLICERSKHAVISMFTEVRMGKAIDMSGADALVSDITESILRHPSALLSLVRLKKVDEYTYMHSVAVCALMIALARQLDLGDELVQQAGVAGLMHDVGKMMIDDSILNKPGRLTDEEFEKVRLHPVYGAKLLLESDPAINPQVYDVCLHHHEKYDGSGYPKSLKGENISLFARMAAVCDVYDAITSDRPYKKGWGPAESLQRMAQWQGHFDPLIFQAFVRVMGIYPVGSLVRLSSGRLAIVTEKNEQNLLKPKVKVFFSSKSNLPIEQEVVDLAQAGCTESISARERIEDWGFRNLDDLWVE